MKFYYRSLLLFIIATYSFAQETGSFRVTNSDFKSMFNKFRFASPQTIPWVGSYWAYGRDGITYSNSGDISPAEKYDAFFGQGKKSFNWEKQNHSCENLSEDMVAGCKAWWGHCNAWAAAGIKEVEPRKEFAAKSPVNSKEFQITVADQKGFLTEMWMDSGSLFAGNTDKSTKTGDWVFDPDSDEAGNVVWGGGTTYEAFWDVTPKSFFLIFTNYVGLNKTGVVIDRFTGDQVWNQPIAGYRFLPIRSEDIHAPETVNNKKIYPLSLRVKIYWAEDGVHEWEISDKFDIKKTSDTESVERIGHHYSGRLLKFKLFFDAPIVMAAGGTTVTSAGNILAEGIWHHEEVNGAGYRMDETHPDFIWLPTQLSNSGGSANPYIDSKRVYQLLAGDYSKPGTPSEGVLDETSATIEIKNISEIIPNIDYFEDKESALLALKTQIKRILDNGGFKNVIDKRNMEIIGGKLRLVIKFPHGNADQGIENLISYGLVVTRVK